MAKMISFLYCEGSQNEITPVGPKLHLVGPMLKLSPMFIPSMFSFSILINIGEIGIATHTLKFLFNSPRPEDPSIIDTGDILLPLPTDSDIDDGAHSLMINMDFRNLPLKYEGIYKGQVYFDQVLLGEYPIKAKAVDVV